MSRATETTPLVTNRFKRRQSIRLEEFERLKNGDDLRHSTSLQGEQLNMIQKALKLGTFSGVFLPTALNVLSILMFLRFGFILGQMGILGTLVLLIMSYAINLLTTLSISAIATNGTVRGGGAYYMISRSLGPEFGGSIGIIFYIGQALNSALNVVGFIEPLMVNFNEEDGLILLWLPKGSEFMYSTVLLLVCTVVSLTGSNLVSKTGSILFVILLIATLSVPVSTLFVAPFEIPEINSYYSGPSWENLSQNWLPHFTKGAAGSQIASKETFNDLFGIFFPATAGIFAGASMSGDLQNPSRAIPKGTLYGLLLTFCCYASVIIAMGVSIPRDLLYKDVQVIQTINMSQVLILMGEFATSLFSVIVGIVGAAKVLQAILRDSIIPGLSIFSKGTKKADDPILAIIFTWALCQLCLFADINEIAIFITMAFLMTFIITNLACFLLKIASLPNFRPSFKFFNSSTAFMGGVCCAIAMFIVDGVSASLVIVFLIFLFLVIHYVCPPKQWGDVSQSLIYHQVRKYLLRLRQDNVKYWRPQILLLVDNPRTSWNLMGFCNHLKKGGLYILGHVMVSETFQDRYSELKKQKNAWTKLRDILHMKAFVQVSLGPTLAWGARNVYLGSGLGGMRPNITVLGFYDLPTRGMKSTSKKKRSSVIDFEGLPTDICRNETKMTIQEWVHIIEDLLILESNVAIARGFDLLTIPTKKLLEVSFEARDYIDLYPIQMSAQIVDESGTKSALSTNFDTYSLILQLGAILTTVPEWKRTHRLRVVVFVEYEEDMIDEKLRVESLLEVLRIEAEVLVLCLSSGDYPAYEYIVKGKDINSAKMKTLKTSLQSDEWFQQLIDVRNQDKKISPLDISLTNNISSKLLKKLKKKPRRYTMSNIQRMGVSFSVRTSRLLQTDINNTNYSDSDMESDMDDTSTYDDESAYSDSDVSSIRSHFNPTRHPKKTSTSSLRNPTSAASITKQSRPNFSSVAMPKPQVFEDAVGDEPSIMFIQDSERLQAPSLKRQNSRMSEQQQQQPQLLQRVNFKSPELIPVSSGMSNVSEASEEDALSFNEISARCQHLILNDLFTKTSLNSGIIFTTLPTPFIGCHKSVKDSLEYIENLDLWCNGLPPVLLINSQTVTVTTAL